MPKYKGRTFRRHVEKRVSESLDQIYGATFRNVSSETDDLEVHPPDEELKASFSDASRSEPGSGNSRDSSPSRVNYTEWESTPSQSSPVLSSEQVNVPV